MASELVPVEREDRDAAARHVRNMVGLSDIAERMECGEMDDNFVVQNYARHRLAALEAQASRIAELEAGHEQAWRDGFQSARDCLSGDDAFCLTEDVETDAWLDSKTRARTLLGDREG